MMQALQNDDLGKLVLRLMVGGFMILHGISKVLNPGSLDFIGGTLTSAGLPAFIAYGVYVGEVLAPLLIIAGVYCRAGGLLIAVNMMFAIGLVHAGEALSLTDRGTWAIELQGFFLFGGLVIALMGSGKFAVKAD